ncbi:MAG: tRNA preQ1(34) S-adenosylmethionine ribosyltransferase-isomerase QueA [Rickettsiales bacterium]|jgi:S-adenosylmethionine:tRNA ribosyltransferase-isomerase|nr:tRNA preQ1(34) S-adenosylmethionine ribosyltransferase-isomerase QueA [Rickettsiales bacterium]
MKLSDFDFDLPEELIAMHPLAARDASRMLVVNDASYGPPLPCGGGSLPGGAIQDRYFSDFISFIRPGDVVVFNNSRVIPARFDAGGFEITLHTAAANNRWWGFCKKFNKLNGGDILDIDDSAKIKVIDKNDDSGILIEFLCDDVFGTLERVGKMPLPPYIKRAEESADRARYQTVYADPLGSMAAPTAGLHFTPELISAIENAGARVVNITLHVGAGTWLPVKNEDLSKHKMHGEWGCITAAQSEIINAANRVIAIGTTSLRLLESANHQAWCGTTDIFITPGYKFKAVDILLTNFHLPKSTLFMLVSAFAGAPQMRAAYAHAIEQKYRFFSYGDCCLLFRNDGV